MRARRRERFSPRKAERLKSWISYPLFFIVRRDKWALAETSARLRQSRFETFTLTPV